MRAKQRIAAETRRLTRTTDPKTIRLARLNCLCFNGGSRRRRMHMVDYGTGSIMLFQPGRLRIEALRWALNEVVRRHDVLRACFVIVEGSPVQVIAAALIVELKVEDLCALPQVERETSALRRARTEVQAPFDLERGPLLRVRVLRLDEQMYWLLLALHHIVTDGWSWQYRRR